MKKILLAAIIAFFSIYVNAITNGVYQILQVSTLENANRTKWVKHEGNFVLSDDFITGQSTGLGHFSLIVRDRKEFTDEQTGITGIAIECTGPDQTKYLVTVDNSEGFIKLIMLQLEDPDNSVIIFKIKKIMDLPKS